MNRRVAAAWLTVLAVVATAGCARTSDIGNTPETVVQAAASSGDGVLDCDAGQVHRDAGITVTGGTEQQVVDAALAEWIDRGAELVGPLPTESWIAVLDGRDLAIAVPELNGDGSWTVHDVQTCGEPDVGPEPIDGALDCANEAWWSQQSTIAPLAIGVPTAEEAVRGALESYQERFGGEIMLVDASTGSLVVDEREQVVVRATEVPTGGWVVEGVSGCEGYSL